MKRYRTTLTFMLALLAMSVCTSCGGGGGDIDLEGDRLFATLTPVKDWKIKSDGASFVGLNRAIDLDKNTYASTTGRRYKGASITLDLSRPCMFNTIVLLHGPRPNGHAGRLTVYTSNDGRRFTPRLDAAGTRSYTYFNLLTPITARYIKIVVEKSGLHPWAISEIYLQ